METNNHPFCNSQDTYFSKKKQKWVYEDYLKEYVDMEIIIEKRLALPELEQSV
jgi:hypothetical protein